jgi:hypothetical protein
MRKIHPGFIALAVLLGPATLILAHETITRSPAQEVFASFDPPAILRQAYTRCAETPKTQRSHQCDEYVSFFEHCAARKNECAPQSVYEVLTKLILSAPPKRPKAIKLPFQLTPNRVSRTIPFTDAPDTARMTYCRKVSVISEITHEPVSTWSEEWQHECRAQTILKMSKAVRDIF